MATNPRDVSVKLSVDADTSGLSDLEQKFDQTKAATVELGKAADAAGAELGSAKKAIEEQREALARLRLTTSDVEKATDTFKATVKAENLAILDARAALREKTAAYAAANAAVQKSAALEKELAAQIAATAVAQKETGATVRGELDGIAQQLRSVQAAAAALVGGQLLGGFIGDVAKTADEFNNLLARVKLAGGDGAAALQSIFDIAQRTGAQVEAVGGLFTKLSAASKSLNLSQQQVLGLTETITQATTLAGESAESANAAIVQFAQGLSAGVLRGQDLNSVLEQAPRLAKAMADGIGTTVGELKKLGEAGSLTSAQIIAALQGQAATLRAEFDQLPLTIGRSIQNLSTSWTQFIGQLDHSSGASAALAGVIESLAKNLDTVAETLYGLGKAAIAFQAVKLAQTFTGIGVAAKTAAAETVAFTAAQAGAAGASTTAAASVSRLGGFLSSLKLGGLVAVLTNLEPIGRGIGEQIAKWNGADKALQNYNITVKGQEAAARAMAESYAALAQQQQIAADKALGLNAQAQALIGTFNKATQDGKGTAEALQDVARALDLSNTDGIKAAITALDALEVRAQITSAQVRDALGGALKDVDLGKFQVEAQAAFDGSAQGVRRLAAAIDALDNEALRRAGLSMTQFQTGIGEGTAKAINDFDALAKAIDRAGAKGADVGNALAASLNKALDTATTSRAIEEITQRYRDMGEAGRISGEQVAAGLDKARDKLDSLTPGVNSLQEAMHQFGLKTAEEQDAIVKKSSESWDAIRDNVKVSLNDQIKAFEAYATAWRDANNGIESDAIKTQRAILAARQSAQAPLTNTPPLQPTGSGAAPQRGSYGGNYSAGNPRRDQRGPLTAEDIGLDPSQDQRGRGPAIIGPNQDVHSTLGDTREQQLAGQNAVDANLQFQLRDKLNAGTLDASDLSALRAVIASLKQQNAINGSASRMSAGFMSTAGVQDAHAWQATTARFEEAADRLSKPPPAAAKSTQHTVNITLPNGDKGSVNMASADDASGLSELLARLGQAKGVSS